MTFNNLHRSLLRQLVLVMPLTFALLASTIDMAASTDRPGTPFPTRVIVTSGTSIKFFWTNTQHEGGRYYDIEINDGKGHVVRDYSGYDGLSGFPPQQLLAYKQETSYDIPQLQYGTNYCFIVRARTGPGKSGIVSAQWANPVCATTPTAAIDAICKNYANTAVSQAQQIGGMQPIGECNWKGNPRWSTNGNDHYGFCIAERAQGKTDDVTESNERTRILKTCVPLGKTASTAKPPASASPAPKPAQQCTMVSVQITNQTCTNGDGTPMTSDPPGALTTVGCGATEAAASQLAQAAFYQAQGPCLDDGQGAPIAGCCTYKKTIVSKSLCACGSAVRTLKRYNACGGAKPVGTAPFCCPAGTVYSNGACHNLHAAGKPAPKQPVVSAPKRPAPPPLRRR